MNFWEVMITERIYHHFNLWEDYHNGMYCEDSKNRKHRVKAAADILGECSICKIAMQLVIDKWIYACEHNLSNPEINRRAWLGQAACSIYANVHEDETREAWGTLTNEQRQMANEIATKIIKKWLIDNDKNGQMSIFD